jgi:3'-phosphoadenosine 5'-phosphosulfate sulfotransferase (PAPS reductase)/FAD synthetase
MSHSLDMLERLVAQDESPRFVIFSSYGNDSVAMIQWAHDEGLRGVVVVYSNTGWAARWWGDRVGKMEAWVHSLGFRTAQTQSIGFKELARKKQAFPTQQFQWCSHALKIAPAEEWLALNDPDRRAVCLVGVRRDEGQDRANFPAFLLNSGSHGGRVMVAPMAEWNAEQRNAMLANAGFDPLPHRSMECSPCVNSNKEDLKALTEEDVVRADDLEVEIQTEFGLTSKGKPRTLFRPHRHMGAVGVREVVKWAHSDRGKYVPPVINQPATAEPEDDAVEGGCVSGWCGI